MMLVIGDIHIRSDNLHLIDILEKQIVDYTHRHKFECIVFLGDILHTHEKLYTQPLNRACKLFENLSRLSHVYILVGNHDLINNQQFLSDQHWLNILKNKPNITVVDTVVVETINNLQTIFVPYVPPGRFIEALEITQTPWKQANLIFAHQEFKGCKMGAIVSNHGDEWPLDYPKIISGHIHDRQTPQPNIYYIGACLQHSFGETGNPKLVWIHNNTTTDLDLELPRKKNVYTKLEDLDKQKIENIIELSNTKDTECVRVVVKGDYEKFKSVKDTLLTDLTQENIKIVFKPEQPDKDEEQIGNENKIRKGFDELLLQKVLQPKDEYLYVAYQKIINPSLVINPNDFIIV